MIYRSRMAAVATTVVLTACSDPVGTEAPTTLTATVVGNIQADYSGSGSFRVFTGGVFTLHSTGAGQSANQGFGFTTMEVPAPGELPIGELDGESASAEYWYDEGNVRNLFRADSGMLRITESSASRVAGEFEFDASLLYVCEIVSGFPSSFLFCDPAEEEATVQITGAFNAGPQGGGGLQLSP
jgi:hypothetical protein